VLLAALSACASSRPADTAPEATLGATAEAEQAIRPMIRRWLLASQAERRAQAAGWPRVEASFPSDPLLRVVTVFKAWEALDGGAYAEALRLARPLLDGPAGTVRDLATLVVGATERRTGHPKEAFSRLIPLLHKLVDAPATALLDDELVRAAVAAREWHPALRVMDAWLFESAPGEKVAVLREISALLEGFPDAVLVAELRGRTRGENVATHEQLQFAETLAHRLASIAVAGQDVRLARVLLDDAGALLGSAGEEIAKLAGDRSRGRVAAHTVGVLLALGSPTLQRRSADVVTGMAFGMRIGDTDARLVARDDVGDEGRVERALMELAAEGAAVIVAGIDARHAVTAARFATEQGLTVVLLAEESPVARAASPQVFFLGQDAEPSVGALAALLRSNGAKVVAGLGLPVPVAEARAREPLGEPAFGIGFEAPCAPLPLADALRSERVDALVALDGAHCGSELVELSRSLRAPLAVGLGAMTGVPLPDGSLVASVGIFPVSSDRSNLDPRLVGWFESGRPTPTWWMGLGRDAAVLAVRGVKDLADSATDADVRARRREATVALAAARDELWTSGARGFDAQRMLPRSVSIARWRGGKAVP